MGIPKKQAVVIIHGMGEQFPMTTIRTFVKAIWTSDGNVLDTENPATAADIWSKPDAVTGSLELRRITTRPSRPSPHFPDGVRTDFFECYWADLTEGTPWQGVSDWFATLLWRLPSRVPSTVMAIWIALWAIAVTVGVIGLALAIRLPLDAEKGGVVVWNWVPLRLVRHWHGWELALAAFLVAVIAMKFVAPYFGDVARYVRPAPANIAIRRDVRTRALTLLRALHDNKDYDRITVAAHSLGTIVAYDLIAFLWAERLDGVKLPDDHPAIEALRKVEALGTPMLLNDALVTDGARDAFRAAQRDFQRALATLPMPPGSAAPGKPAWLICDLVTFGSPLTHAEFLLAKDRAELDGRKAQRGYPTCPPVTEPADDKAMALLRRARDPRLGANLYSYVDGDVAERNWKLHHAAPFAATRWTNLYDPPKAVAVGDVIGGPLAPVFGLGIKDVPVRVVARRWGRMPRLFTHTGYWSEPKGRDAADPSEHILELREAVDILAER